VAIALGIAAAFLTGWRAGVVVIAGSAGLTWLLAKWLDAGYGGVNADGWRATCFVVESYCMGVMAAG
jgi:hypothetical protein